MDNINLEVLLQLEKARYTIIVVVHMHLTGFELLTGNMARHIIITNNLEDIINIMSH